MIDKASKSLKSVGFWKAVVMTNVTERVSLPTEEELTVKEVTLGYPYLKAGANHLGKYCEPQNNEFMLCRFETDDPRKCLKDGAAVTDCTLEFFSKVSVYNFHWM